MGAGRARTRRPDLYKEHAMLGKGQHVNGLSESVGGFGERAIGQHHGLVIGGGLVH
jgi:hypothetical protein